MRFGERLANTRMSRALVRHAAGMAAALFLAACSSTSGERTEPASTSSKAQRRLSDPTFDAYGGLREISFEATGRFRVAQRDGRWWLVTLDGNAFFSHGIQGVSSQGTESSEGGFPYSDNILQKYGSLENWTAGTLRLLERAGMNTIGDFSELELFGGKLPYVASYFTTHGAPEITGGPDAFRGRARDFYAPEYVEVVSESVKGIAPCAADPYCIGVFYDDEVPWAAGLLLPQPLFDAYLYLDPGAPGKVALQEFLEDRYEGDIVAFNETWGSGLARFDDIQAVDPEVSPLTDRAPRDGSEAQQLDRFAFRAHTADYYFSLHAAAITDTAPGVLNLGSRFLAAHITLDVVEAAARHSDVVSINAFEIPEGGLSAGSWTGALPAFPLFTDVRIVADTIDAPILLSSFGYRAEVEGLNDFPPTVIFDILESQEARADAYQRYMEEALEIPSVVGAHWFFFADQPSEGRPDGADSNWGIVNIDDDLYEVLVERMGQIGETIYD